MTRSDFMALPDGLPVPTDDGACDHLAGRAMPAVSLVATDGRCVDLSVPMPGRTVVYAYPRTGRPDAAMPEGWDSIPGARGCTPQSCGFRDHHAELQALDARVFGLSTQTSEYQREMVHRLHLPFAVLSDADLHLVKALDLPTFEIDGMVLVRRLTLIVRDGRIEHVFYPVFPPDAHAGVVIDWLSRHAA